MKRAVQIAIPVAVAGYFLLQSFVHVPVGGTAQMVRVASNASGTPEDSLIIEPQAGIAPVLSMIANASSSIDLVMYELTDTQVEQALAAAEARGITVRVLLNKGYYGKQESKINQPAYDFFASHGVAVHWTPAYFALTHQKTIIADGSRAIVMSFNFTPKYYASSRDFGVIDTDAADATAIEDAFNSDWQSDDATASQGDDLLWSPGSEAATLALINSAAQTLEIYNEEMADPAVTNALVAAAARGVKVEIVMTYSSNWKLSLDSLKTGGVSVHVFGAKATPFIHAKVIIADKATAFVGSENFSVGSLQENRELGIVLADAGIVSQLETIFQNDYQAARPF
jgi:cardiolipin synthase